jgi:DNA-binding NarL/FixJ family response regulator
MAESSLVMNNGNGAPEDRPGSLSGAVLDRRRRIFVIEDCPIVGQATATLIQRETDLECCGMADGCSAALEKLESLRPDLVILGSGVEDRAGLGKLKKIKTTFPKQQVLLFSIGDEALFAARAIRAGAAGFVMKGEPTQTLLAAVRRVLSGKLYVGEQVERHALRLGGARPTVPAVDPQEVLTERELQVFRLTGQGNSRSQIARLLGTSPKAVDHHRGQIKDKLCLKSANDMVRHAIELERDSARRASQPETEKADAA